MSTPERPETPPTPVAEGATTPQISHDAPAPAAAAGPSDARADAPHTHADAGGDGANGGGPDDAHESGGDDAGGDAATAESGGGGPPGGVPGTGKKRRRRRKKGGAGAGVPGEARTSGEGAPGEGAPGEGAPNEGGEGTGGESSDGARADGAHGERGKRRKRDRGPRPAYDGREPPPFGVGDLVFGRILDVNEDAALIDLSGKGLALFDRLEMEIADAPATPAEAREHAAEEAREHADEGAPRAPAAAGDAPVEDVEALVATAGGPPVVTNGVAPGVTPAAADATAQAGAETPAATDAPAGGGSETQAGAAAETQAGAAAEAQADAGAAPDAPADAHAQPGAGADAATAGDDFVRPKHEHAPLPPLALDVGAPFVGYVHNDGGRGGLVVVTRHPKRASLAKPLVAQALKDKTLVKGLVTGVIKGGVEVDVHGLRAFAPGSHMDLKPGADLTPLLARRLDFHVTQYGKRGRDVVLSRRSFLEAEARANREAALAKLKPGTVVEGVVRSVVAFGAFIDVGGVEGLVPLQEMSHNRSDGPNDVFKVGETVPVKILKIDERSKVWLSRRATMPDPWAEAAKKYTPGTKHMGKVVRLQPFGAFIELESGIDGLIHVADLSEKRIDHPQDVVKVGDAIEVVVASNDVQNHKIALHPAPTGEAANETPQRIQLHRPLKVVVVSAEQTGLVVRVRGATGRHARGFIPAGGTGTPRGTELRKLFPVGKELEAKVIEMDPRRGEIKLSIRALTEDSERTAYTQYRQQLSKEARFTFADLIAKKQPQK